MHIADCPDRSYFTGNTIGSGLQHTVIKCGCWWKSEELAPQNKCQKSMVEIHQECGFGLNPSFVTLKDSGQILNLSKTQLLYF